MGFDLGKEISRAFRSTSREAGRLTANSGFDERAKSGKLRGWKDILSATGITAPFQGVESRLNLLANPFDGDAVQSALTDQYNQSRSQVFGANLGHQAGAALFGSPDDVDAPLASKAPAQNEKTLTAKKQARQRAINAAAQRRGQGLSGTIATSPLGLQGDGAATSSRRLIGE